MLHFQNLLSMKIPIVQFYTLAFALAVQSCGIQAIQESPSSSSSDFPPNAQPGKCYAKCMVWRYDTTTQHIDEITVRIRKLAGTSEWREVLCGDKVLPYTIRQIQASLIKEGYAVGKIDGKMNPDTKASLTKFQEDKKLPVGNLDIETLDALGISHE